MLEEPTLTTNNTTIKLARNATFKTEGVIYVFQCMSCDKENVYTGKTAQQFSERNNGHRSKFNMDQYDKSALATHSYQSHGLLCKLKDFRCAVFKKTSFINLDREEYKLCEKLRTNTMGLNRCKIVKQY